MRQILYRTLIELTNRKWTSILLKSFARSKASRFIIPSFSKIYRINEAEIEKKMHDFSSLHAFFIRRLKEGARLFNRNAESVLSPVDAIIEDIGEISSNHIIKVKGKEYSILEMLGKKDKLKKYEQGTYMIFYLSPSHYHRIHSPITGEIVDQWSLGDRSYPVNKFGLKFGKRPLSKNYRVITELKQGDVNICMVKVGAMFVNSIELLHDGNHLVGGNEMAYFSFGSTVILLFEKDTFSLNPLIKTPENVQVGDVIGEFIRM